MNRSIFAVSAIALSSLALSQTERVARFDPHPDDVLIDEEIPIAVSGLTPQAAVVIRLRGGLDGQWTSSATFTADASGRIDLARMAPVKGSYRDVDPMGLFWSAERGATSTVSEDDADEVAPDQWTLTAETGGEVVARTDIRRRAVSPNVRVRPVHDGGMVATFYEPTGGGAHPAFLVLTGSGGGLPPTAGPAGGLASHGYAVLALAYFGVEGLPRTLSNIPLEYFGAALRWLTAQPSVDPHRVGVLGGSRGGELALLLGSIYPTIRTVVAYMPSNVINRGCCDMSAQVAWTYEGRPLAPVQPMLGRGRGMVFSNMSRPEIPVERIQGAVLLFSGRDDGVWDSARMAERVIARLRRYDFKFPYQAHSYDHAGHAITRPYTSTMNLNSRRHPLTGRTVHMGGTPAGTAKAREDSWRQMLAFVDQHLRDQP
jgi:dienelactone hydrolase